MEDNSSFHNDTSQTEPLVMKLQIHKYSYMS